MIAPKLALSRPAALTGRVGQGGDNRVHDVALVQALLGAKRAKGGRPYLSGNVTGSYDKETAVALLRFRMDQRDANIKRPLARSGPMLNKLAQGQALAVLKGTATPYKIALPAEPGPIKGAAAELLSAERKVALQELMKAFARDWHIAFNVEVEVLTANAPKRTDKLLDDYESRPLVARFSPRNLSVHIARGLSVVPSNAQFRARAKALYQAVAADLKARCAEAFAIKDPVDVKIQQGLKDDLACVVRTDLEGVEGSARFFLADFRKKGFSLAVRFFENYLKANADPIQLSREDALAFDDVQDAVAVNIERFTQNNLIAPKSSAQGLTEVEAITKNPEEKVQTFEDHWVKGIESRALGNRLKSMFGFDVDPQSGSIGFGIGGSNLTSTGKFLLQRKGDRITVTVSVTHVWSDPGYDFDRGKPFYDEAQVLERHGKAKPFKWKAEWDDVITGELQIVNAFSPNATRRWIGFEVRPLSSQKFP